MLRIAPKTLPNRILMTLFQRLPAELLGAIFNQIDRHDIQTLRSLGGSYKQAADSYIDAYLQTWFNSTDGTFRFRYEMNERTHLDRAHELRLISPSDRASTLDWVSARSRENHVWLQVVPPVELTLIPSTLDPEMPIDMAPTCLTLLGSALSQDGLEKDKVSILTFSMRFEPPIGELQTSRLGAMRSHNDDGPVLVFRLLENGTAPSGDNRIRVEAMSIDSLELLIQAKHAMTVPRGRQTLIQGLRASCA